MTRGLTIGLVDVLVAALGVHLAALVTSSYFFPGAAVGFERATAQSVAGVAGAVVGCYLVGLHDSAVVTARKQLVMRGWIAALLGVLAALFAQYALWFLPAGRIGTLLMWLLLSVGLVAWRLGYAKYLLQGPRIPVLVLGTDRAAQRFAKLINGIRHTRYAVVGFVGASPPATTSESEEVLPYLGTPDAAVGVCAERGIRMIAVATNGETPKWFGMLGALQREGVRVTTAGALAMEVAQTVPLDIVTSSYLLDAFERLDRPVSARVKRLADVMMALLGLTVFALIFPIVYLVVKADSRGPFIFSQERVGQGGKPFRLYKIRTMKWRPEDRTERWSTPADGRVTWVGKALRQLRIDEFPQFWNVLKGEMSVVGPRPEQPALAREIERQLPAFAYRTIVKPGITGWAQIHQGYAASIDESAEKLSHDLYYVRRACIALDVDIMLRTLFVMVARLGSR